MNLTVRLIYFSEAFILFLYQFLTTVVRIYNVWAYSQQTHFVSPSSKIFLIIFSMSEDLVIHVVKNPLVAISDSKQQQPPSYIILICSIELIWLVEVRKEFKASEMNDEKSSVKMNWNGFRGEIRNNLLLVKSFRNVGV